MHRSSFRSLLSGLWMPLFVAIDEASEVRQKCAALSEMMRQ